MDGECNLWSVQKEVTELQGYRVMGCSIKNVREVHYQVGNETNGRKTMHIRGLVKVPKSKGMALSTVHTHQKLVDSLPRLFLKRQGFRSQRLRRHLVESNLLENNVGLAGLSWSERWGEGFTLKEAAFFFSSRVGFCIHYTKKRDISVEILY